MSDQHEQNSDGNSHVDNYSNIKVIDSTGTAIGHKASARVTTHGLDGKDLMRVFAQVNELIEQLDDSKYDKQRLKFTAVDLKEELGKPAPDKNFINRCWDHLKKVPKIAAILSAIVQPFLPQG